MEFFKFSRKNVIQLKNPEEVFYLSNKNKRNIILAVDFDKEMEDARNILDKSKALRQSLK